MLADSADIHKQLAGKQGRPCALIGQRQLSHPSAAVACQNSGGADLHKVEEQKERSPSMCESLRDMNSVNVCLRDMSQLIAIVVHILKTVSVVLTGHVHVPIACT